MPQFAVTSPLLWRSCFDIVWQTTQQAWNCGSCRMCKKEHTVVQHRMDFLKMVYSDVSKPTRSILIPKCRFCKRRWTVKIGPPETRVWHCCFVLAGRRYFNHDVVPPIRAMMKLLLEAVHGYSDGACGRVRWQQSKLEFQGGWNMLKQRFLVLQNIFELCYALNTWSSLQECGGERYTSVMCVSMDAVVSERCKTYFHFLHLQRAACVVERPINPYAGCFPEQFTQFLCGFHRKTEEIRGQ